MTVIYRHLHSLGHIKHWKPERAPALRESLPSTATTPDQTEEKAFVMDLHGFSRGMAFAALHVAIEEVGEFCIAFVCFIL